MSGQPVAGFGFHERTLPLSSPRQLVVVLHDSVRICRPRRWVTVRCVARQGCSVLLA